MLLLSELSKFRTKKRSSNNAWVAWAAILSVAIAASSALTALLSLDLFRGGVRFYNLRAVNAASLQKGTAMRTEDSATLEDKSPMIFIGAQNVVIGSVASVVAPHPDHDVLLLSQAEWQQNLLVKIRTWKRAPEVFPAKVIAVAFHENKNIQTMNQELSAIVKAVGEINKETAHEKADAVLPKTVLVRVAGAVAQEHAEERK